MHMWLTCVCFNAAAGTNLKAMGILTGTINKIRLKSSHTAL